MDNFRGLAMERMYGTAGILSRRGRYTKQRTPWRPGSVQTGRCRVALPIGVAFSPVGNPSIGERRIIRGGEKHTVEVVFNGAGDTNSPPSLGSLGTVERLDDMGGGLITANKAIHVLRIHSVVNYCQLLLFIANSVEGGRVFRHQVPVQTGGSPPTPEQATSRPLG